ncbi:hypothetical protein P152DRAFT_438127 [Eremomyces bilateralis CBS 781.70]|uniref:Uncharacterized protein n=1 Tax=Eremomyces bilateralis CBS 781.70 TaxID=1392243 RepID=A0A6G1G0V2_9PEZI|nr:uncharacterized protein P152DRAFT_438127 [Eremomyces bilateralis CBS 781.70]KAF1811612.1 hypothetical protein P152DRAFT_438127 [Eremomyces bilateralis CBS 781.70]
MPPKCVSYPKSAFHYNDNTFYAEASNGQRHRRAAIVELKALFHPADPTSKAGATIDKDPVAHWYEAQLMHYGLVASKTKAVAKSRLLDAVNAASLKVPAEIARYEKELKKEWQSQTRAVKKAPTTQKVASKSTTKKRGRSDDSSAPLPAESSKKKQKPTVQILEPAALSSKSGAKDKSTGSARPTPTAKRGEASTAAAPRLRQTARRGTGRVARGGTSQRATTTPSLPNASETTAGRPKQTARRGADSDGYGYDDDSIPQDSDSDPEVDGPLGMINGTYYLHCPDLDQWSQYNADEFTLSLCLAGTFVWGAYDFGAYSGILCIPRRPYEASDEKFEFTWRGRENGEGVMSFGPGNHGWIRFLRDGRIEGKINCYGNAHFEGEKGDEPERSFRDMKNEWDGYNEDNYNYENRARWGGGGW